MALSARVLIVVCSSLALIRCQTITEEPVSEPGGPTSPAITVPVVITPVATPIPAVSPTPSANPTPGAEPTPAPTPDPTPAPTPPPTGGGGSCAPGNGSGSGGQCRKEAAQYVDVMGAAIDDVVAKYPEMFNLNDKKDVKAYKVLDPTRYHDKVAQRLRQMGYCASVDNYEEVGVKESNAFAESYDILTSSNYIWRGLGSYQVTCRPPWF